MTAPINEFVPVGVDDDILIQTPQPRGRPHGQMTPAPVPMPSPLEDVTPEEKPHEKSNITKLPQVLQDPEPMAFHSETRLGVVTTNCEEILESATIDWKFQWPDGLLKSWHMIRAQGDEDAYIAMWMKSEAERKVTKGFCSKCWWASKGVDSGTIRHVPGMGANPRHARLCTAKVIA
mmetsp:Transcript_30824/g.69332  ORF Transcript_30824/g.69332 Transcript_30824/m.69332 type:complete len:177 (+) Transcript_30824:160-690(+)